MNSLRPPGTPEPLADLVHAYLDADYRWQHVGDWHDLKIGLPVPALELLHPDQDSFGFLSAWNPRSAERAEAENRRDDGELHSALLDIGCMFHPGFASAANRSWREPSWLVMGMSLVDFDALARRFGQLGTLWWTRGLPIRLRIDAARPASFGDDRYIDWMPPATPR